MFFGRNPQRRPSNNLRQREEDKPWVAVSLNPVNFLPGLAIGFLLGMFFDLSAAYRRGNMKSAASSFPPGKQLRPSSAASSGNNGEELKMVLVVRQDLKMGAGKIASQCAHAATGIYAELLKSHRSLLRQWEQYGQAKIVLSCKNQQEMNKLKDEAEHYGLPTFVVADAGRTQRRREEDKPWVAVSLNPVNFLPGLAIGFLLGMFFDLSAAYRRGNMKSAASSFPPGKQLRPSSAASAGNNGEELKMVLVVRQDLKMGAGKIASQCAHAATGIYTELLKSHRSLLRQWEQYGQAKIVLSCKNQQEMNKLKDEAEHYGLPTFVVADAGRTQIQAGSRTVLAIGPGSKAHIDSVTGKLRLL